MAKTILFVYGTLKTGQRNHHLLGDQRFLGPALTAPHYRLHDLGRYPGLTHDRKHGLSIKGELWEVTERCLSELDDYEEVPDLFVRDRVALLEEGRWVQAYFYDQKIPFDAPSGEEWPMESDRHIVTKDESAN